MYLRVAHWTEALADQVMSFLLEKFTPKHATASLDLPGNEEVLVKVMLGDDAAFLIPLLKTRVELREGKVAPCLFSLSPDLPVLP